MKCVELLWALNESVDGTGGTAICEECQTHMAGCNPCRVVVDNVRQTMPLYQAEEPLRLPVRFRYRLHTALRRQRNCARKP